MSCLQELEHGSFSDGDTNDSGKREVFLFCPDLSSYFCEFPFCNVFAAGESVCVSHIFSFCLS